MPIFIFTAVVPEARPIMQRLGIRHQVGADPLAWQGDVDGRQMRLVVTGMGRQHAAHAARTALGDQRPRHVLITGLCGGLDPNLSSGQVIQFSQIVDDPTGKTFDAAGADHIRHRLVSSKRIITTRQAKAELHQRRQAAAVDMESASIAAVCEKLNLRWSCIRAVCDPADEALPAQLSQIVRPNGTTSVAAGLRTALLGPHRLPAMLRLSRRSRSATRSLANAVENWHRKEARAINNATPTPVTADVDD